MPRWPATENPPRIFRTEGVTTAVGKEAFAASCSPRVPEEGPAEAHRTCAPVQPRPSAVVNPRSSHACWSPEEGAAAAEMASIRPRQRAELVEALISRAMPAHTTRPPITAAQEACAEIPPAEVRQEPT